MLTVTPRPRDSLAVYGPLRRQNLPRHGVTWSPCRLRLRIPMSCRLGRKLEGLSDSCGRIAAFSQGTTTRVTNVLCLSPTGSVTAQRSGRQGQHRGDGTLASSSRVLPSTRGGNDQDGGNAATSACHDPRLIDVADISTSYLPSPPVATSRQHQRLRGRFPPGRAIDGERLHGEPTWETSFRERRDPARRVGGTAVISVTPTRAYPRPRTTKWFAVRVGPRAHHDPRLTQLRHGTRIVSRHFFADFGSFSRPRFAE